MTSQIYSGSTLVNYPGGKIYLDLDRVPHRRRVNQMYEPENVELFHHILEEGMVVVDVGACRGFYTLIFANLVGEKGRILAFEPDPENSYWLFASAAVNGYPNIRVFQFALADENGVLPFYQLKYKTRCTMVEPESYETMIAVKTCTLDSLFDKLGVQRIDVMKIDVEGFEERVLDGAQKIITEYDPMILTEFHSTEVAYSAASKLEDQGYKLYQCIFREQTLFATKRKFEGKIVKKWQEVYIKDDHSK